MKKKSVLLSDFTLWVFTLAILFTLSACKSSKKDPADTATTAIEKLEKETKIEKLSGYPIPTSFEITRMLHEAGASYILSLSNASNKVGDYISSRDKALNLGVYGTDLSYASTYLMKQETMLYLESSKSLIDELGIASAFEVDYVQRVEENLDNRDTLINIISDLFYDTWNHLTGHEKDKLAILVVSGSWIEGLFITTQIAITAADNSNFLEIIAHQKSSLSRLLEVIEPVKDDVDVISIYGGLLDLSKIYEGIEEKLSVEQLEQLSVSIEQLRNSII